MKNNINDRINILVSDRKNLLNLSKENITDNNRLLSERISNIVENYDNNSKTYKAIVKAKEMIYQLTEEISCANTIEDIVRLRKKINYYINKIKKELAVRNIDKSEFDLIQEQVSSLRNNIAKYLRFLKRDNTLKVINRLYDNFENLTKEECSTLRKMISNELRYNKRILNKSIDNEPKTIEKDNVEMNSTTPAILDNDKEDVVLLDNEDNNLLVSNPLKQSISNDEIDDEFAVYNLSLDTFMGIRFMDNNNRLSEEYLFNRINHYKAQYLFSYLLPYDGGIMKNILSLLRNLPNYKRNNRLIRCAIRDYNTFYHGDDLNCFIVYSKKRNSIANALATIFKSSHLSKRERELLDDYDKCLDWIFEFYHSDCIGEKKLVKQIGV